MKFHVGEQAISDELRSLPDGLKFEEVRTLFNGWPTVARLHVEDSRGCISGCPSACDSSQQCLTECISLAKAFDIHANSPVGALACLYRFGPSPPSSARAAFLGILYRTAKHSANGRFEQHEVCLLAEAILRSRPALAALLSGT